MGCLHSQPSDLGTKSADPIAPSPEADSPLWFRMIQARIRPSEPLQRAFFRGCNRRGAAQILGFSGPPPLATKPRNSPQAISAGDHGASWISGTVLKSNLEQLEILIKYVLGEWQPTAGCKAHSEVDPPWTPAGTLYKQIFLDCLIERLYTVLFTSRVKMGSSLVQLLYPSSAAPRRQGLLDDVSKVTRGNESVGSTGTSKKQTREHHQQQQQQSDPVPAKDTSLFELESSLGPDELLEKMLKPVLTMRERRSSRRTSQSTASARAKSLSADHESVEKREETEQSNNHSNDKDEKGTDIDEVTGLFTLGYVTSEPSRRRMEDRIRLGGTKAFLNALDTKPAAADESLGNDGHFTERCLRYADDFHRDLAVLPAAGLRASECSFVCISPSNNDGDFLPSGECVRSSVASPETTQLVSREVHTVLIGAGAASASLAAQFWSYMASKAAPPPQQTLASAKSAAARSQTSSASVPEEPRQDYDTIADFAALFAAEYMHQFWVDIQPSNNSDSASGWHATPERAENYKKPMAYVSASSCRKKGSLIQRFIVPPQVERQTALAVLTPLEPLPAAFMGDGCNCVGDVPPLGDAVLSDNQRLTALRHLRQLVVVRRWQEAVLPWLITQFHIADSQNGYEPIPE
jgi:hypothetical protein